MVSPTQKNLQKTTYFPNGIRVGIGHTNMQDGEGVPISPLQVFLANPYYDNLSNYVATTTTFQNVTTPQNISLNQLNSTVYGDYGQPTIALDCNRKLKFCVAAGSALANNGNVLTWIITGYDDRGILVQDKVTYTSNAIVSASTVFVLSHKCFYRISSIVAQASTAITPFNFTIGLSNSIGFPFYIPSKAFVLSLSIGNPAGTLSIANNVIPGYNFYINGVPKIDDTDARGFIKMDNAGIVANEGAAMGTVTALLYSYGADSLVNSKLNGTDARKLFPNNNSQPNASNSNYMSSHMEFSNILLGTDSTNNNNNNPWAVPFFSSNMGKALSRFDITGVQYPGDTEFQSNKVNKSFNQTFNIPG